MTRVKRDKTRKGAKAEQPIDLDERLEEFPANLRAASKPLREMLGAVIHGFAEKAAKSGVREADARPLIEAWIRGYIELQEDAIRREIHELYHEAAPHLKELGLDEDEIQDLFSGARKENEVTRALEKDYPISLQDASAYLSVHEETLRKLLKGSGPGRPPGYRIGVQWKFYRSELDRWLKSRGEE